MCSADRLSQGDDSERDAVPATRLSLVSTGESSLMVSIVLSWFPPPPCKKGREM